MGKIVDGVYYNSKGQPTHRGAVKVDGKIYYASRNGEIAKNCRKVIHHGYANGVLDHGSYYFDKDGVCNLKSFRKKRSKGNKGSSKKGISGKMVKAGVFAAIFAALCVIAVYSVINLREKKPDEGSAATAEEETLQEPQIEISLPEFDEEVYLCSNALQEYYNGECTLQEAVESGAEAYQALEFEYTIKNAEAATLLLSENEGYSGAVKYDLEAGSGLVIIDNLKTGTEYYYLVTAEDADGKKEYADGSFRTADTNRFVSFDGVYNTRDIGRYKTLSGKRVKQGMLIRGTEIDGLVESTYFMRDVSQAEPFGFVCDFDLRNSSIFNTTYVSRLGSGVIHKFYASPMYGAIFAEGNELLLNQIFTDLADADNYPMYLHCTYGADRTGTIVFLLQGLLGVSEEDMKTEYELTGFYSGEYVYGYSIESVCAALQGVEGETINEKIENYMLDTVGITEDQIQMMRDILLE